MNILANLRNKNFLSLAGNSLAAAGGFAGFMLLARSYTADVFGEWVIFVSGATFVEMFRFGLTRTATIRYLSGTTGKQGFVLKGANWAISFAITVFAALVLIMAYTLFKTPIDEKGFGLFFKWYPWLAFANLSHNNALTLLQAEQRFDKILIIKLITSVTFPLLLTFNFLVKTYPIEYVALAYVAVNGLSSLWSVLSGWDGIRYIFKATKASVMTILNFGKFTTFTLIGSNLLKSADTFIISLSPLGTAAVAAYSIPLKLTELLQIPLRSFTATAFPEMSKFAVNNLWKKFKSTFYLYSGSITLLFVPITIAGFIFAGELITILGGQQYINSEFNTVLIFRIFSLYSLLLPLDRITGIALDSLNKPKLNFFKVCLMVSANVIGDLIAVFIFESLSAVAFVTVVFTMIGVVAGFLMVQRNIELTFGSIFTTGIEFYKDKLRLTTHKEVV